MYINNDYKLTLTQILLNICIFIRNIVYLIVIEIKIIF